MENQTRVKLTDAASISSVIAGMTVQEKVSILSASSACMTTAIPELDIPAIRLYDGATGVNSTEMVVDYNACRCLPNGQLDWMKAMEVAAAPLDVMKEKYKNDSQMRDFIEFTETLRPQGKDFLCFPSGVNIGATWNLEMAEEIGKAVGWEMRSSNIDVCLGPNVDIQRDPLGGRNYEMYGEDPYLVSRIGTAFIRGMQDTGVAACAKHFMANNQETQRETKDNHVSERTLREIYSPGFMSVVKEAKVKSVMSAYSSLNGTFASYNRTLLTELLKKEWGFEGVVVSDWGAASENKEKAIEAGLDIILTGPNDMESCVKAVQEGKISKEELDEHVFRILKLICDLKAEQQNIPTEYDVKKLLDSACKTIADGAVLLKNDSNTLPLQKTSKVIFWGSRSKSMLECGSGSTNVITSLHTNVYEETKKLLGQENVVYEQWEKADVFVYTASAAGGEGADRERMDIDAEDREKMPKLLQEAKSRGLKTVVILNVSGPVDMRSWLDYADAVLCIFIPGCMGGRTTAQLLIGERFPAGRLPVTFPVRYQDTPSYPNFPGEYRDVYYGEGIFVGYRSYEKRELPVQFPFGFGMNYTEFEESTEVQEITFDIRNAKEIQIPVKITNIGNSTGSEVIQLYISECDPHLLRPVKELKAFGKLTIPSGESAEISLILKSEDLACFDPRLREWVVPVGEYKIYLGTSSENIFSEIPMTVYGENPYVISPDTLFSEVVKDPKSAEILEKYFPGILANDGVTILKDRRLCDAMAILAIGYMPDAVQMDKKLMKLYTELAKSRLFWE